MLRRVAHQEPRSSSIGPLVASPDSRNGSAVDCPYRVLTMVRTNEHGQPIGAALTNWDPPPVPSGQQLVGRTVTLVPIDSVVHAAGLYEVLGSAPDSLWTYMTFGPFPTADDLEATLASLTAPDFVPYTIVVDRRPLGFATYLRMQPFDGVIEIGAITLSPALQNTTPATEAIYSMIDHAFDLGYRRVEWKCDDLNEPSRSAAIRLGFTFEGIFRQATHYKGRNRDTAWYAITDQEWPPIRQAYRDWLSPDNFDADGRQLRRLGDFREGSD